MSTEPSHVWNSGPELQPQTHLIVAQDALGGVYKAIRSDGWICSLQTSPTRPRWAVGTLRERCSSPTAVLLLLSTLHRSLLTG